MSKRLNKKTTIPKPLTSSLETDLKHDWDARDERYWVNKAKFWEFLDEYNELQDGQQNPVSVELHIIVEIKEFVKVAITINVSAKINDPIKPDTVFFGLIFVSFLPLKNLPNTRPPISVTIQMPKIKR